jgi:hypothetical protein
MGIMQDIGDLRLRRGEWDEDDGAWMPYVTCFSCGCAERVEKITCRYLDDECQEVMPYQEIRCKRCGRIWKRGWVRKFSDDLLLEKLVDCGFRPRYTRERVKALFAGRTLLSATEVLRLDIPAAHRIGVVSCSRDVLPPGLDVDVFLADNEAGEEQQVKTLITMLESAEAGKP